MKHAIKKKSVIRELAIVVCISLIMGLGVVLALLASNGFMILGIVIAVLGMAGYIFWIIEEK